MTDSGPDQDAHSAAIFDYASSGGRFAILAEDAGFVELVRSIFYHTLGLPKSLSQLTVLSDLFALLHQDTQTRYVILLDQDMASSRADQVLESILGVCPGARIIIVTQEVDQYATALWVERGAYSIITKPATIAAVIEKLALAVGLQGRLGKLIDKGKKLLEAERWGEALMAGDEILAQKPDNATAYMIRGDAFMGLDMPEKAESMFMRAAENEELYLAPLKRLAALYEQAGDADKHLECLRRLHEISPLDTERMLRIGRLEMARGSEVAASEMFEGVLDLVRKEAANREALLSGKIADMCAGLNPDMAVHYSRKALELRGAALSAKDIATVNILGIALRKQGKWREAIVEYRRILDVVPNHAGLIYNMALACSEGGQTAQAHAWMLRALELDPVLPASGKNVAFNIGIIFQKAGFDGTPFFKKAYEQDPNDHRMWEALKRAQRVREEAEGTSAKP